MKINEAFEEIGRFNFILNEYSPAMAFEFNVVERKNIPFKNWFRNEVPGDNVSKASGVYFIADMDETILYIGKAGSNNLGAEIWGKFGAPNSESQFITSPLAKWAPHEKYIDIIINGNILIAAATIQPQEFVSLIEVYLHVWCVKNCSLPVLNKRIG